MTVAIVFESMFGSTRQLAEAVGWGISDAGAEVIVSRVGTNPPRQPESVELVILAAPTHSSSLSTCASRADAVDRGARAASAAAGMRGWLNELDVGQGGPRVTAVFDTQVRGLWHWPGASAARSATRILRKKGIDVAQVSSFFVETAEGPICPGEIDRARARGRSVAEAGLDPAR